MKMGPASVGKETNAPRSDEKIHGKSGMGKYLAFSKALKIRGL